MCDWLTKAINCDIKRSETPFSLPEPVALIVLAPASPTRTFWLELQEKVNNSDDLDDLWARFTVVDKVLTLFGDENWNDKNLQFFGLQHHVWWISQAQSWLSLYHVRTCQEYIQISMSALILELVFRFVWARHTQRVFMKNAPTSTGEEKSMDFDNSEDEVLEASDLECASESDSMSVLSDSSFIDNNPEEIIMKRDNMGKLKDFFTGPRPLDQNEEDEEDTDSNSDSDPSSGEEKGENGRRSAMVVESEHTYEAGAINTEDWLNEVPRATSLFFAHSRVVQALEVIEKQYWVDEKFDIRIAIDLLLRLTLDRNSDLQLPTQTPSSVASQMTYAYDKVFVPFLTQLGITVAVPDADEKSESPLFEDMATLWTFNKEYGDYWVDTVLKCTFSNLTNDGYAPAIHFAGLFPQLLLNADSKTDAHLSNVYESLHSLAVSKGSITPHIESLIKTLDALSAEKNVLLRQNKAQIQTPLSEKPLSNASGTNPSSKSNSSNGASSFFATVLADGAKQTPLNANLGEDNDEDPDAAPTHIAANSLEGRLREHRLQRIKQIDTMIEEIRSEVNSLTGHIDMVQSKRRARRSKAEIAHDAAMAPTPPVPDSAAPSALFQSEEELWGLPLAP